MTTQYPNALDQFSNPSATDMLNSAAVPHHQQHTDANDAIEAIQSTLGTDPAGAFATVKDRLVSIEEALIAPSALNDLTDVTITSALPDDLLKYNGTAWVNSNVIDGGVF